MTSLRMFCLSADEVERCWDDFAHHLERLTQCGADLTPQEIRENALKSRQQIWGLQDSQAVQGVAITEILATSSGLTCLIVGACGSASKAMMHRLHDEIARWAKSLGCTRVRIHGRRGWLRFDRRYRPTAMVMEMAL
jgi:hypothetical protein